MNALNKVFVDCYTRQMTLNVQILGEEFFAKCFLLRTHHSLS
jgi:hypothetical protein